MVSVPAAAIVFLYSWDPLSLKGNGLGELTVFLMFGPVLALGVNVAVLGSGEIEPITLCIRYLWGSSQLLSCLSTTSEMSRRMLVQAS